jgi:hypothetical protein
MKLPIKNRTQRAGMAAGIRNVHVGDAEDGRGVRNHLENEKMR